jgi:lipopolysaccharide assembly outer membrane protein LptD (OstA)
MRSLRATVFVLLTFPAAVCLCAQEPQAWEIGAITAEGYEEFDLRTGVITATNGVAIHYSNVVLVAWSASVNTNSGEVIADGNVRIQRDDQVWVGEHMRYNFKTRQIEAEQFRTGKTPVFIAAKGLHGDESNRVYFATNASITTDDVSQPFQKIRAKYIKIIPGQSVQARDATLFLGSVPVFYFPYYSRKLGDRADHFDFIPGFRSIYGPFLLSSYTWFWGDEFEGKLHLDYREKRGVGTGADANFQLGRWGDGTFRYYYLRDQQPETNGSGVPFPENRQVVEFSYQSSPLTNLSFKSEVNYQSDAGVLKEFFERAYRQNPQPGTFFDATKFFQNFSLDLYSQPRINDFFETVERLPEVKLTGYRQQIGALPLYYESESSFGYYHRRFAETNGPAPGDFAAARADTYHQVVLPWTLFGWLNVTPRAGGRLTYYSGSSGEVVSTNDIHREVFNTGAEISFKASRTWPTVRNDLLQLDGLRHIIEPSVNYVFVPAPNHRPSDLPQFDYETASLLPLPIEFPDYNAIDSIDSQNVLRFSLRNRLQTKRAGGLDDLLNWEIFTDWRLRPRDDQTTFSDAYSDLVFKPRSWLTFESENRFDIGRKEFSLAREMLTLQPETAWSWGITYYYLRDDPATWGPGSDVINSALFYRINENWGLRATHYFDASLRRMQEQDYSIYRDLRSWTAALVFRLREDTNGRNDFTFAFTFSLKAHPRFGLGTDTAKPYSLLGS